MQMESKRGEGGGERGSSFAADFDMRAHTPHSTKAQMCLRGARRMLLEQHKEEKVKVQHPRLQPAGKYPKVVTSPIRGLGHVLYIQCAVHGKSQIQDCTYATIPLHHAREKC